MYILLAILAGVSIVLSRIVNYVLADKIGLFQGTFFNYLLGFLGSFVLLLISGDTIQLFSLSSYQGTWWAYTGGLVGVGVIALSSHLSSKISAFYLTLLLFVGQLFGGMVLDYIVSGDFSLQKIIGGLLVVVGLSYNLWIDSKGKHTKKDSTHIVKEGVSSI
ncbi:MAG: DMT family transporter [Cellulosilyticum sp.]|nr:DMT family transporter [Cellulosilyticum sp.]